MKIEKLDSLESLFKNHITHKYLENNPLFSIENIEYQKHYRTDIVSSENLSFAIRNADIELLFVFIVYKHKTNSGMEFSNFGLPIISLEHEISPPLKKIIVKEILKRIDFNSLISYNQFNLEKLDIFSELLINNSKTPKISIESNVDLLLDYNIIRQSFRKSYKSLISKFTKKIELKIYNSDNINLKVYAEFKNLHFKEAGRITRSEKTWEIHFDMIKNGSAVLICAELNEELIGAALFIHSSYSAYYGVSASNIESKKNIPITHLIIDKAIHYFKDLGMLKLILGKYEPNSKDEKLRGISGFKSAFSNEKIVKLNFQ
jgi:hypothetical protein